MSYLQCKGAFFLHRWMFLLERCSKICVCSTDKSMNKYELLNHRFQRTSDELHRTIGLKNHMTSKPINFQCCTVFRTSCSSFVSCMLKCMALSVWFYSLTNQCFTSISKALMIWLFVHFVQRLTDLLSFLFVGRSKNTSVHVPS